MDGAAIFAVMVVALALVLLVAVRRTQAAQARLARLRPPNACFVGGDCRVRIEAPGAAQGRWQSAFLFVTNKRVVAYARRGGDVPLFECAPHEIEGFWRPVKYEPGYNEIELHAQAAGAWVILRAQLWQSSMMGLVRALKSLVSDDMIRAYRQRRPYIYRGPETAHLATQDIYGAWTLDAPLRLYLMPAALVLLAPDGRVQRVIALRDMQDITMVKRFDTEGDEGLIRFEVLSTQESLALALADYEGWGQAIAAAARRTLEEPITRKGKPENDEWAQDEYDEAQWAAEHYIISDDGELRLRE